MKRMFTLMLIAALAMTMFVIPASAEEPKTIEFWYCVSGANGTRMEEIIAAFNASHDDYQVHGVYQGDYLPTLAKVKTSIAAGTIPCDMLMIGSEYAIQLFSEDAVVNLLPYFEKSGVDYDDFIPGLTYYFRDTEGNQYGIPFGRSTPAIFVNEDLMAELNLEVPKNWDEMEEICKAAIAYDENGEQSRYGWAMSSDEWFWLGFMTSHGAKLLNEDKTGIGCAEDGSLLRAGTRLQRMYQEGGLLITPTNDDSTPRQMWLDGKALFHTCSVAYMYTMNELCEFNWSIIMPPADVTTALGTGGNGLTILKGTGNEDAAWEFMHWLLTDEQGAAKFVAETGYYPFTYSMTEDAQIQAFWDAVPAAKKSFDQLAYADDSAYYCGKLAEIRNALRSFEEAIIFDGADVQEQVDIMADTLADVMEE